LELNDVIAMYVLCAKRARGSIYIPHMYQPPDIRNVPGILICRYLRNVHYYGKSQYSGPWWPSNKPHDHKR
jgi:hypothetical protein